MRVLLRRAARDCVHGYTFGDTRLVRGSLIGDTRVFRRNFDARDGRVVDGGGLEKRIDRFVEFANFFVKSARGARYGSMIELRPVAS